MRKIKRNLLSIYRKYAKKRPFHVNMNKKELDIVLEGLARNEAKYGFRYCPCRRPSGDPEKDKDIICPCRWHEKEIKKNGRCLCGLFVETAIIPMPYRPSGIKKI